MKLFFFLLKGGKRREVFFASILILFCILVVITISSSKGEVASISTSSSMSTSVPTSVLIQTPTPTIEPRRNGVFVKVVNVVDGDTIKVETGETVRYIGIDTPETVDPRKPVMCYGNEASAKNTELVEGKIVELEKDVSKTDKYGRLLRYIWLDDVLINELLVREGYARSSSYPPDVKYQHRFIEAQRLAQEEQKGLWSGVCASGTSTTAKPTNTSRMSTSTPMPTIIAKEKFTEGSTSGIEPTSYTCNCTKTCGQMSSCAEAQYQLTICGCSQRDVDSDGYACDSDCQ